MEEHLQAPQTVNFLTAGGAALKMVRQGLRGSPLEGAIEIGAETVASEEADHDRCWTPAPGADILMPS